MPGPPKIGKDGKLLIDDNTTLDDDTTTEKEKKKEVVLPSHEVRLPEEGHDWVYEGGSWDYDEQGVEIQYAIVLVTHDAALAEYYASRRDDGLEVAREIVRSYDCEELEEPANLEQVQNLLRDALSERYIEDTGKDTTGIARISLTVEYCSEYWVMGGVAPDPDYPEGY